MRKAITLTLALVALSAVAFAGIAVASDLHTFGTGVVTAKKGVVRIVNDTGEYGGIYKGGKKWTPLASVAYSFVSSGDVVGGAPRWSIPIDTDGVKKSVEGYAFIDAAGCGATVGDNPTSTPTLVSTTSANCKVFYSGDNTQYANWAAFAAAFPTAKLGQALSFVIADAAGDFTVTDFATS